MSEAEPKNGVWVGLRDCGCCAAVVVDNDEPHMRGHVRATKREFLDHGLSVVHATWEDWQTTYLPTMRRTCEHMAATK